MSRLVDRVTHRQRMGRFLADPQAIAAALDDADPPPQLQSWLKRLEQLYGVPFRYLVPHPRMLPNEAIRFFQLDFNWLFALIEGACSLGQASESDAAVHGATQMRLHAAAAMKGAGASGAPDQATGFLLRSQVVPGWPKLEVVAFDKDGTELKNVLRMARLSESVLLYLVEGVIDHVIIREPAVGLHFGIDIGAGKPLRYVTVPAGAPAGTQPGDQISGAGATPEYRDATHRVLKINQLAGAISARLFAAQANNAPDGTRLPFTSAEYALEMVEGTQEVTFQANLSKKG